jgi:hypothetical protein
MKQYSTPDGVAPFIIDLFFYKYDIPPGYFFLKQISL